MSLIVLLVFFVLLWVLFILPQQRRVKAQEAFVAALELGDEVVTAGGIHGRIVDIAGDTVKLEVSDNVVLTLARGAVVRSQHVPETSPGDDPDVVDPAADDPPATSADVVDSPADRPTRRGLFSRRPRGGEAEVDDLDPDSADT